MPGRDQYLTWHPKANPATLREIPPSMLLSKAQLDQWARPTNGFGEELHIGIVTDGHEDGTIRIQCSGPFVLLSCDCGARKITAPSTVEELRAEIDKLVRHPRGTFRAKRRPRAARRRA